MVEIWVRSRELEASEGEPGGVEVGDDMVDAWDE